MPSEQLTICISLAPLGQGGDINPGMITVDYAVISILKEAGKLDSALFCRLWAPNDSKVDGAQEPLELSSFLTGNVQYGGEEPGVGIVNKAILYWGDFQHGNLYSVQAADRLVKAQQIYGQPIDSLGEARLNTVRYFQLDSSDGKFSYRYASYGTTLFQNTIRDVEDKLYLNRLSKLVVGADFIRFRDSYSANIAAQLKNEYALSYRGTDCALLSTKQELDDLIAKHSSQKAISKGIGWFVGRSTRYFPRLGYVKLINSLSKSLACKTVEVPWSDLGKTRFGRGLGPLKYLLLKKAVNIQKIEAVSDLLHIMREQHITFTDTYHVAVNSWALGVPAVLIYEPAPRVVSNCNMGELLGFRDKRMLFGLTEQLEMFTNSAPLLKRSRYRKAKVAQLDRMVKNPELYQPVLDGLRQRSIADRNNLVDWLKSL